MEAIPMEWIDKLFTCMGEFYEKRWSAKEGYAKTVWKSALQGLTYDEIRGALVLFKQAAKNPISMPPHQLEFYHVAKGRKQPDIYNQPSDAKNGSANPDIARMHLAEIRAKLHPCST